MRTGLATALALATPLALALALSLPLPAAAAATAGPPDTAEAALQARVMHLADGLRCLVCQNETVAASHAELAVDLRQQIRRQIEAGLSDDAIRQDMVRRYGDFVLYQPPWKASTWLLWLGPFALLAAGAWQVAARTRRQRPSAGLAAATPPAGPQQAAAEALAAPPTDVQLARARALLRPPKDVP